MFVVPFRNADFKIIYVEEEKRIVYLFLFSLNTELTTVFQNLIEYKMKLLQPMNIYIYTFNYEVCKVMFTCIQKIWAHNVSSKELC